MVVLNTESIIISLWYPYWASDKKLFKPMHQRGDNDVLILYNYLCSWRFLFPKLQLIRTRWRTGWAKTSYLTWTLWAALQTTGEQCRSRTWVFIFVWLDHLLEPRVCCYYSLSGQKQPVIGYKATYQPIQCLNWSALMEITALFPILFYMVIDR